MYQRVVRSQRPDRNMLWPWGARSVGSPGLLELINRQQRQQQHATGRQKSDDPEYRTKRQHHDDLAKRTERASSGIHRNELKKWHLVTRNILQRLTFVSWDPQLRPTRDLAESCLQCCCTSVLKTPHQCSSPSLRLARMSIGGVGGGVLALEVIEVIGGFSTSFGQSVALVNFWFRNVQHRGGPHGCW